MALAFGVLMVYGIMALRAALKLARDNPGHCGTTVRDARFDLDYALAQRDNDRRDARLLRALRFIDFPVARRVRAAMASVADNFVRRVNRFAWRGL